LLVKGHNTEGIYALQDLVSGELHDYHMSLLRPFLYDERTGTPEYCKDSHAVQSFLRDHAEKRVQRLAKPIETEVVEMTHDSDSDVSDDEADQS